MLYASTFWHATPSEKALDLGRPVVTASTPDCVDNAGLAIDAVTTTDVCAVPELTTVWTVPSDPEVAFAGASDIPPTVVLSAKLTSTPGRGPPLESTTLKITVEVSLRPVPF